MIKLILMNFHLKKSKALKTIKMIINQNNLKIYLRSKKNLEIFPIVNLVKIIISKVKIKYPEKIRY